MIVPEGYELIVVSLGFLVSVLTVLYFTDRHRRRQEEDAKASDSGV